MFTDLDAVEEMMGKSVEGMTAHELVTYVKTWIRAVYGLDLPASPYREKAIFASLKRTYGDRQAGLLVKWPYWRYNGKRGTEYVTYNTFNKGMKWQLDLWYLELQKEMRRELNRDKASAGFAKLQDI